MHFTQATVALIVAAIGVAAIPTPNDGAGSAQGGFCNAGSAYCMQSGFLTKGQTQECSGANSYCCSSGNGANILTCANAANGLEIGLRKRDIVRRDGGGGSGGCNGGSTYCLQQGFLTKDQGQTCEAGGSYCCSSGDGLNALSCAQILGDLGITLKTRDLVERFSDANNESQPQTQPQPQGQCNGGSAMCYQSGVLTKDQGQECNGGSSYCCSSGSGLNLLTCTSVANGATIDLGLGDLLEMRHK